MKNLWIMLFLILFSFCFNQTDSDLSSDFTDQSDFSNDYSNNAIAVDDSTNLINGTDSEPKPRIILLGFENFKIIEKIIYFNVIFRQIYGNIIFPHKLKLTIHVFNEKLRNLGEEINTIECPRDSNDYDHTIKFNCSKETHLDNIIKVSADKNYSLIDKEGNTIDDLVLLQFLSGYANRTIGNIQDQKDELKDFIILQNSTVYSGEKQFFILGNISDNENIKDNTEVTLYIDENENGTIKEIPCIIHKEKNQLQYYELECTPIQGISFHLDNVDGKILNKHLIVSMRDGENDYISFPEPKNDFGKKKVIKD